MMYRMVRQRYGRTPAVMQGAKENKKSFAFLSNNNVGLYPEHPFDFWGDSPTVREDLEEDTSGVPVVSIKSTAG